MKKALTSDQWRVASEKEFVAARGQNECECYSPGWRPQTTKDFTTKATEVTGKKQRRKLLANKQGTVILNPYPREPMYFSLWSLCALWWIL
jgi:hypothetical protein